MTQATNAPGWPIVRGVQTLKEIQVLTMRQEAAAAGLDKLWADTFLTNAGIDSVNSLRYVYRGAADYDVIKASGGVKNQLTAGANNINYANNEASYKAGVGQTFTPAENYVAVSCTFRLRKGGSPTGTITAKIFAVSAGVPTGAALAESAAYDVSGLTTSYQDLSFVFLSSVSLASGTTYALILESGTYVGDAGNYLQLEADTSGSGAGTSLSKNGSTWTAQPSNDFDYSVTAENPANADIRSVQALNLSAAVTSLIPFFNVTLGTGTATYYASTDDGATWTAVNANELNGGLPSGSQIRLRCVLTGNAQLEDWGVAA